MHKMVDLLAISLVDMTVVCLVPLRVVLMVWKRELWLAVMKVVPRVDSMDLRLATLLVMKMV